MSGKPLPPSMFLAYLSSCTLTLRSVQGNDARSLGFQQKTGAILKIK